MAVPTTTKRLRREFKEKYGSNTYDIVRLTIAGKSSQEISNQLSLPSPSVRTTRGNYTRGTYGDLGYLNFAT